MDIRGRMTGIRAVCAIGPRSPQSERWRDMIWRSGIDLTMGSLPGERASAVAAAKLPQHERPIAVLRGADVHDEATSPRRCASSSCRRYGTRMQRFSLSAVGQDQPGIVAAVTGVLADMGCNLQDSTMARLQGQFAMVLIVSAPAPADADALERALRSVCETFALVVAVRPLQEVLGGAGVGQQFAPTAGSELGGDDGDGGVVGPNRDGEQSLVIAVHGADRAGIVHGITAALAADGGSIVDLTTHLVGDPAAPVYTLVIRAVVPATAADAIADRVTRAADELGVRCTIHPDDPDVL